MLEKKEVVYSQVICQLPILHFYSSRMYIKHIYMKGKYFNHGIHAKSPLFSTWKRKVKRERKDSSTAETQLASQSCPARLEAAACWANVLFPLLHKYTPTFTHKTHMVHTWSSRSQSEAPQCVLFSWGRGMKRDVVKWKNSECDRPEAGCYTGSQRKHLSCSS